MTEKSVAPQLVLRYTKSMTTTKELTPLQAAIAKAMRDAETKRIGEFLKTDDVWDMLLDIQSASQN